MKTRFMCTHKAWRYCSTEEERIIVEDTDLYTGNRSQNENLPAVNLQLMVSWLRKEILGTPLKGHLKMVLVMFLSTNVEKLVKQPGK